MAYEYTKWNFLIYFLFPRFPFAFYFRQPNGITRLIYSLRSPWHQFSLNKWKPLKNLTCFPITVFLKYIFVWYYQIVEHELQYFLSVICLSPPSLPPQSINPVSTVSHSPIVWGTQLFVTSFICTKIFIAINMEYHERKSARMENRNGVRTKIVRVALYCFRLMNRRPE